jgi:hypothetical protein
MDLRDQMQNIALECYGSRRMRKELKVRGWEVNRYRVSRPGIEPRRPPFARLWIH